MHHSPDTQQCLREAWRVLKPGGRARIMLYHHPSLTGAMLWLRYGILRGLSLRQTVYEHLESPGTKSYTRQVMMPDAQKGIYTYCPTTSTAAACALARSA